MKKILTLALVAASLIVPYTSYAADKSDPEKHVIDYYADLQEKMNKPDYDTAIEMVKKHFAKDFLHYDDGEVSYGKDGMILFIENHKKANVRTEMNIDIYESSFDDEISEVKLKFNISQKFFKKDKETGEEIEDKAGRINLKCVDNIRYTNKDNFGLYKCDCITIKDDTSTEETATTEETVTTEEAVTTEEKASEE